MLFSTPEERPKKRRKIEHKIFNLSNLPSELFSEIISFIESPQKLVNYFPTYISQSRLPKNTLWNLRLVCKTVKDEIDKIPIIAFSLELSKLLQKKTFDELNTIYEMANAKLHQLQIQQENVHVLKFRKDVEPDYFSEDSVDSEEDFRRYKLNSILFFPASDSKGIKIEFNGKCFGFQEPKEDIRVTATSKTGEPIELIVSHNFSYTSFIEYDYDALTQLQKCIRKTDMEMNEFVKWLLKCGGYETHCNDFEDKVGEENIEFKYFSLESSVDILKKMKSKLENKEQALHIVLMQANRVQCGIQLAELKNQFKAHDLENLLKLFYPLNGYEVLIEKVDEFKTISLASRFCYKGENGFIDFRFIASYTDEGITKSQLYVGSTDEKIAKSLGIKIGKMIKFVESFKENVHDTRSITVHRINGLQSLIELSWKSLILLLVNIGTICVASNSKIELGTVKEFSPITPISKQIYGDGAVNYAYYDYPK